LFFQPMTTEVQYSQEDNDQFKRTCRWASFIFNELMMPGLNDQYVRRHPGFPRIRYCCYCLDSTAVKDRGSIICSKVYPGQHSVLDVEYEVYNHTQNSNTNSQESFPSQDDRLTYLKRAWRALGKAMEAFASYFTTVDSGVMTRRGTPRELTLLQKVLSVLHFKNTLPEVSHQEAPDDQLSSNLFQLPYELRRMIFAEVLRSRIFYVRRHHYFTRKEFRVYLDMDKRFPLLLSCKRAYLEARDLLFSHNTFQFDCLESFIRFSSTTEEKYLGSIQRMNIPLILGTPIGTFLAPHDRESWMQFWQSIADLKGRDELELCIRYGYNDAGWEASPRHAEMLEILEGSERAKVWEERMPWPTSWKAQRMPDWF